MDRKLIILVSPDGRISFENLQDFPNPIELSGILHAAQLTSDHYYNLKVAQEIEEERHISLMSERWKRDDSGSPSRQVVKDF